jgi:hypothetical protein
MTSGRLFRNQYLFVTISFTLIAVMGVGSRGSTLEFILNH